VVFPQDELGLRGYLELGGVQTEITADLYTRDPITHTRGRAYRANATDPAQCTATIKNKNGTYTLRNAEGPYFGQLVNNTPFQFDLPGVAPYLATSSATSSGVGARTVDAAQIDVTGDLDVRIDATLDNWLASGTVELCGKGALTGDQRSWFLAMRNGNLHFEWSAAGTSTIQVDSTVDLPVPASQRRAVRVTLDVNNGASGNTATFYYADTIAGPWTQLGAPVVNSGTTSIFNSTAVLAAGNGWPELAFAGPSGRIHSFEMRNGINGTLVAAPNFALQTPGATSFVDSTGLTWTVGTASEITNRVVRFNGEVPEWPAKWATSEQDAWTPIETAGILRRLGQGKKTLDSTLRRRIPSGNPIAYWPLEDGRDSTQFYSPIAGVNAIKTAGMTLAADDSLAGSNALPAIQGAATLFGTVPAPSGSPTTWHTEFVFNLPNSGPATARTVLQWTGTGTVKRWRLMLRTGVSEIYGYDADDNVVTSSLVNVPSIFNVWSRWQLYAVQNGSNVDWTVTWIPIGGVGGSVTTSFAGTVGHINGVKGPDGGYSSDLNGMLLGHIATFTTATTIYNNADIAFNGETAAARIVRLCTEEGVPLAVLGDSAGTQLVGPQRPAALLDLLRAAAEADGGIFGESRDKRRLQYRTRESLYNQTPRLTLDYAAKQIAPPFEPVDDDQVRNEWSVQRDGGSTGVAALETGPLSIEEIGYYPDSATLALFSDEQTDPIAGWLLHLTTWNESLYPSVTLRLHRHPEFIPDVLDLDIGDKIRIENLPKRFASPGAVELLVDGWQETLLPRKWEITFNCSPAGPWTVGELTAVSMDWVDTSGSELAAAATSTATTLDVLTTADRTWTDDPSDYPWDIAVGGEHVRVAAGGRLINANPFVDSDASGWTAQSLASIAWSTAVVHPQGTGSVFAVPNGVSSSGSVAQATRSAVGSINVGATYVGSFWVYSPAGWPDFRASIDWYTSADVFISTTSSSAVVVAAGAWTFVTVSATAPATASRAAVRARQGTTPAASDVWYAWGIRLTSAKASWLYDDFGRTVASSWGTSDSALAWSTVGGSASDYSVASGYGVHVLSTVDVSRITAVTAVHPDFDVYADITTSALATGDSLYGAVTGRMVDSGNMYLTRVEFTTSNTIVVTLRKIVAGVQTALGTYTVPVTHVAGTFIRVRFQARGTALKARAWLASAVEPTVWHMEATDTALTAAAQIGTRSIRITGNTNGASVEVRYDNVNVINPQVFSGDRSRNSVVKAQTAGEDVRLAFPTRVAL